MRSGGRRRRHARADARAAARASRRTQVTVFEAAPAARRPRRRPGSCGDVTWDRHYHVTLLSDAATPRRCWRSWGSSDECEWVETKTGFYTDGRLLRRCRTRWSSCASRRSASSRQAAPRRRRSCARRRRSRTGARARARCRSPTGCARGRAGGRSRRFWLPLLRAKLGDSYHDASAAFIWATIARMYAARRSGLKKEMFGYVRGGYAPHPRTASPKCCAERGVELRTGARVRRGRAARAATVGRRSRRRPTATRPTPVRPRRRHRRAAAGRAAAARSSTPASARGSTAVAYQGIVCALAAAAAPARAVLRDEHHRPGCRSPRSSR